MKVFIALAKLYQIFTTDTASEMKVSFGKYT